MFYLVIFYLLYLVLLIAVARNLFWKLLLPRIKQAARSYKIRLGVTIFICVIFLCFGGWAIHHTATIKTSSLERIKSLPYLSYVAEEKNNQKDGVVLYNNALCYNGINIYFSEAADEAYLMDMAGNILHRWTSEKLKHTWHNHNVKIYNDEGDLLASTHYIMLMRLGWNSDIKWVIKGGFNQGIDIAENKDIYALYSKNALVFKYLFPLPIKNDYIAVISSEGRIKSMSSFYKILKNKIPPEAFIKIFRSLAIPQITREKIVEFRQDFPLFPYDTPFDIIHANTIQIINRDIDSIFKKGNILFCSRELDFIGVIDLKEERLLWSWGKGILDKPHYPTLLENGHILVFDNGKHRGYSRVIEVDPKTEKIVWQYKTNPPELFFSDWGGQVQRLPNGNTLITQSDKGRVFEVTKEGRIVWDFYSPERDTFGRRSTIIRFLRIIDIDNYSFAKKLK